jgi:hypothetical protein
VGAAAPVGFGLAHGNELVSAMSPADRERARIRAVLDAVDDTLHPNRSHAENDLPPDEDEPEPLRPWGTRPNMHNAGGALPLLPNTNMNNWRADAEEWKRKQEHATERHHAEEQRIMHERKAQSDAERNAWAERKINAAIDNALAEYSRGLEKTLGQVVAEIRFQMKEQISGGIVAQREELANAIDKLRQEFLAVNKVIDVPSPLIRKVKNNAA